MLLKLQRISKGVESLKRLRFESHGLPFGIDIKFKTLNEETLIIDTDHPPNPDTGSPICHPVFTHFRFIRHNDITTGNYRSDIQRSFWFLTGFFLKVSITSLAASLRISKYGTGIFHQHNFSCISVADLALSPAKLTRIDYSLRHHEK